MLTFLRVAQTRDSHADTATSDRSFGLHTAKSRAEARPTAVATW
jgi:hypothetical protein